MLNYKAGHVLCVLVLMCRPDFIIYEIFDVDKILDWLLAKDRAKETARLTHYWYCEPKTY